MGLAVRTDVTTYSSGRPHPVSRQCNFLNLNGVAHAHVRSNIRRNDMTNAKPNRRIAVFGTGVNRRELDRAVSRPPRD